MPCTAPTITLLEPFRPALYLPPPLGRRCSRCARGTLLARGRRTVTAALWYTGHEQDPHFSTFHQVLNRARWSPLQASRHVLTLLSETFVPAGGTLDSVIDETRERRWGRRSAHGVAAPDAGLAWGRATSPGDVYGHCLVVSLWLNTATYSVGPHARSRRETAPQGPLVS